MERYRILARLCALSSKVGRHVFQSMEAPDCFCTPAGDTHFQFSEKVLLFIEEAVNKAIMEHGLKELVVPSKERE